ncbi:hypothetical protein F4777DRAFT_580342 [Nemania sp. FL0916]|nr:hypothetical protein F4777DRAFT_580342 [Nemania sp. FL0916]
MSATSTASIKLEAPEVSLTDIEAFHAAHFSHNALSLFKSQFLQPDLAHQVDADYEYYEEEEEDDLGYYSDGVKRTLTDEQIAIFRHSELEALRRAETKAANLNETESAESAQLGTNTDSAEARHAPTADRDSLANSEAVDDTADGSEDGEIETEKPVLTKAEMRRQKRLRARKRKRETQKFQPEKKPDLRKRTWDVVEAGMDTLYYDDLDMSHGHGSPSTTQRKQISYDD